MSFTCKQYDSITLHKNPPFLIFNFYFFIRSLFFTQKKTTQVTSFPSTVDQSHHHIIESGHAHIMSEILESIGRGYVSMWDKFSEHFFSQGWSIFFEPTRDESCVTDISTSTSRESLQESMLRRSDHE